MTAGNQIVTVQVSQTIAPAPSTLQKTGAFISQGGTTKAANTKTLLTQLADLTAIIAPAATNASITWTTNVATVTTTAPHGLPNNKTMLAVIAGATSAVYNGTFLITVTGTSTFTYPLLTNPGGSASVAGTYQLESAVQLTAMGTTFFAQGSAQAAYVLELGAGSVPDGVAALSTYITANPGFFYSYLVPREWDSVTQYLALLATFESDTAKTYFFTTTTNGNFGSYTAQMKDVLTFIEAPSIPVTEFSAAAPFYVALNYTPSAVNQVTPYAFSFLVGVTPYPTSGNASLFSAWKAAGVNWVGTGAEGGISTAMLLWGTTMDLRDFIYWYSVDWVQINEQLALANEVINGSNNPQAPLYYDQPGINRLQARAQGVMNSGIAFGLVLGPVTVNAIPFATYVAQNPSDFPAGIYNGLSVTYTPKRGFKSITFFVNVTDFPLP